jgi:methylmalonyl-CoA/ethylmalonyl-CoA epimerase
MLKIEHIGIAVKDIEKSNNLFTVLLGIEPYKTETVESEKVTTSFFKTENTKIELLEASGPESAISKFIEKRGEGIHHIAFEVDDIEQSIIELKQKGFVFISEQPKIGADNKLICFIHPKSANGMLVEICQEIKHSK